MASILEVTYFYNEKKECGDAGRDCRALFVPVAGHDKAPDVAQDRALPASFNAHVRGAPLGIHQNLNLAALGRQTAAHEPNHITALKTVTGERLPKAPLPNQ